MNERGRSPAGGDRPADAVLDAIRDAEQRVGRMLSAAQARADERLAEARREADRIRAEGEARSAQALAALAEAARAEVRREADAIVARAEEAMRALRARAAAKRAAAADLILRRVLPMPNGDRPAGQRP
jgi:V/A-type H+-transporting ATPase subunit G/H